MAPDKPEDKSVVQSIADGLNPTKGTGFLDKVLPLIGTLAYFTLYGFMIFGSVPKPEAAESLMAVLGPLVGVWLHRSGQQA